MKIKYMRVFNKKLVSISLICFILFSFFNIFIVAGDGSGNTLVFVNPSNQIVSLNQNFNISIDCNPQQPIKSFEFKLSFDETLLEANSVSEGNIFSGYSTFFNSGIINNSAGTIINVYGLILGAGNVTGNGSFVNISFTSKVASGVSSINLYDVGVTNETIYVPINVTNGSVEVDGIAPEIVDNSPVQGYTGDSFTFSVDVSDNCDSTDNLSIYVDWSHGSNSGNDSMVNVGGSSFERSVTLDLNSVSDLTYNFFATDSYGNFNETSISSVTVLDNDFPSINSISANPGTQEVGGRVNLSAEITDNIGVDEVYINITYPDSSTQNISIISNVVGDFYFYNQTFNQYGTHDYFFWTFDQAGNDITSSINSFEIGDFSAPVISGIVLAASSPLDIDSAFGWINISCQVVDNVVVTSVYLNITNPDGSWNNVSMSSGGSDNYYLNSSSIFSGIGNYSYLVWAEDNDLNSQVSSSSIFSMPPNYDVNLDGVSNVLDIVAVSNIYASSGSLGWVREDVDNNGVIQVLDFVIISNHFDEVWWV